ncbi:MAG: redoxin domain-containing protein [Myxococcota bacterium]|nr:redoxin domain-containing protein [Myxococcota bacterium]
MKPITFLFALSAVLVLTWGALPSGAPSDAVAAGPAALGAPAPGFTLPDTEGQKVSLSSLQGKTVVLEWFNADCPFVKYAHGKAGPLRSQPDRVMSDKVVWLAVNSSAPGKQGSGLERNRKAREEYQMSYPVLLDPDGTVGRLYGAKTTPHMFVIDPAGVLVYSGGLDGAPMGNGNRTNHVDACLTDLAAGGEVRKPSTKPYGCSVKY